MRKKFTISVFSENRSGLLNRITAMFSRRKINIESLTVSESEIKGVHRHTISIDAEEHQVIKVVNQLEKQIEIHKAFYHGDENIVHQEIALYKISTAAFGYGGEAEKLVRRHHARVLAVEPEFAVIEKTGHKEETQALFDELEPYGILEFVRSGRVAITKPMKELKDYLKELEEASFAR